MPELKMKLLSSTGLGQFDLFGKLESPFFLIFHLPRPLRHVGASFVCHAIMLSKINVFGEFSIESVQKRGKIPSATKLLRQWVVL